MERDFVFLRTPKGAAFAAGCVKGLCRKVVDKRFLRLTGPRGRCVARVQRVQRVVVSLLDSAFGAEGSEGS